MFVLVDMEWVENRDGDVWPTQLTALRVDESWDTVGSYSTLIRPKDGTFQKWNHMAFTGWNLLDFLEADSLSVALPGFLSWLKEDDVLCWWHHEARDIFSVVLQAAQLRGSISQSVILSDYVYYFLKGKKGAVGSPYRICDAFGIAATTPAHCSLNDVLTLQSLLQAVGFPQSSLNEPPQKMSKQSVARKGTDKFQLLYDPGMKLLHRSDCAMLPEYRLLPAFPSFVVPIRKQYRPCTCCREEYLDTLRSRNRDSIARSKYNYVYTKQSRVFHRRDCPYALLAQDILGAATYETCLNNGRRPCKHCNPQPMPILVGKRPTREMAAHQKKKGNTLSKNELQAIGRFVRANEERDTALKRDNLSEAERGAVMALSQPGLAFWAGQGCRTFHRRNCPKIRGLTQLRGFSRFQNAVRAGYTPCRHCKPSSKQDVVFSIPIDNQERDGETAETLVHLCQKHQLPYEYDTRYFVLKTLAGKWRIDMSRRPVHLEHINLVSRSGSRDRYHVQPRLFLSLQDTFQYIIRHDSKLIDGKQLADDRAACAL